MYAVQKFRFIEGKAVDVTQWDNCVMHSPYGLMYSYSFYLDHLSPGWSGLIGENYDWVFPVISNRKIGISYLFQPPFTQQLGVVSKKGVVVPYHEIIEWLKAKFSFWEVCWDPITTNCVKDDNIKITKATNYVLDLSNGYDAIAGFYHNDLIKNLKRSRQFGLLYHSSGDYQKCIDLFVEHYSKRMPQVSPNDYINFRKLCDFANLKGQLICRIATNDKGDILSTALLLCDGKRMYNMMNTTTANGRRQSANHFLFDAIIHEFAGQKIIFDFEGSDLPGVKAFYENFGGINAPYYFIKYNQLPWPIKLLKQ